MKELNEHRARLIHAERFYGGNALRATSAYGGLPTVIKAYGRIREFIRKFQNTAENEPEKVTGELTKHADEAFRIITEAESRGNSSPLDKHAASLIAKDLLRRGQILKGAGLLDEEARGTFNADYSDIRELLDQETIGKNPPPDGEAEFPLAYVFEKVARIELAMDTALRTRPKLEPNPNPDGSRQVQTRVRKKK